MTAADDSVTAAQRFMAGGPFDFTNIAHDVAARQMACEFSPAGGGAYNTGS